MYRNLFDFAAIEPDPNYQKLSKSRQQPETTYDVLSPQYEDLNEHVTYLEILQDPTDKSAESGDGVSGPSREAQLNVGEYEEVI